MKIKYFNNHWLTDNQQIELARIIDFEIGNFLCSFKTKYQSLIDQQLKYHDNESIQFICSKFQQLTDLAFGQKTKVLTCWFVVVKEDSQFQFHTHKGASFTGVYFLKNCKDNGTVFKFDAIELQTICEDNTGIIFNSSILHSTPIWKGKNRYAVTVDLVKI